MASRPPARQPALTAAAARAALRAHADPARAAAAARFFKTGPGEYGEGDRFIGVSVPVQRTVARAFRDLPLPDIDALLTSPIHEDRLTALLILVDRFNRSRRRFDDRRRRHPEERRPRIQADQERRRIFRLYVRRLRFVNNWDLVDTSAPPIVGGWLADQPRDLLDRLARSPRLWTRRVAMLGTLPFIAAGEHRDALRIAGVLVNDQEELMHKAVGWMLREVGNRAGAPALDRFLARHAATMPRTMLRYAIERLPPAERERWMRAGRRPPPAPRRE